MKWFEFNRKKEEQLINQKPITSYLIDAFVLLSIILNTV